MTSRGFWKSSRQPPTCHIQPHMSVSLTDSSVVLFVTPSPYRMCEAGEQAARRHWGWPARRRRCSHAPPEICPRATGGRGRREQGPCSCGGGARHRGWAEQPSEGRTGRGQADSPASELLAGEAIPGGRHGVGEERTGAGEGAQPPCSPDLNRRSPRAAATALAAALATALPVGMKGAGGGRRPDLANVGDAGEETWATRPPPAR